MDTAVDPAAASSSSLATVQPAGGTQTLLALGPCLYVGMGEASMVEQLNAWGISRDQELIDLRANPAGTQVIVSASFDQAKAAPLRSLIHIGPQPTDYSV